MNQNNPAIRREENDVQPVFWEEIRLGFSITVVNNSYALMGLRSVKAFLNSTTQ